MDQFKWNVRDESRLLVFVLLFLLFLSLHVNGQPPLRLKFHHLDVNNGLPQNSIYSIVEDKYGFMWFGTWGGVVRYDGYTTKVFRAIENDSTTLPDNRIHSIIKDTLHNIWVRTGEHRYLYQYNYENEKFTPYLYDHVPDYVKKRIRYRNDRALKEVESNRYRWISDYRILKQIDRHTGDTISYLSDLTNPFAVSDNIINVMLLDTHENLWIGTQSKGINYANLNHNAFNYYHQENNGKGLIQNNVRAVCVDRNGRIWVGSENKGITIIQRGINSTSYTYLGKDLLNDNNIRALYCDKLGCVWIGTKGGLVKYEPNSNTFKDCSIGLCNPNVFSIFEDNEDDLWIGTFNGIARFDRANETFECLSISITGGREIRSIIEDKNKNLWIATEDAGVTKLIRTSSNKIQEKFYAVRYKHESGNLNSLINNRTYSLVEDNDGMIWIATNSGLSRLNPQNETFINFSIADGLSDDITMGVLFDGKESIWLSHKKGLTKVNTKTLNLRNFNLQDGLQGNEFNQSTCYRDTVAGEMFFGGTNGLNSFFPDSFKINHHKPKVVFTHLNVMQQAVSPGIKINHRVILEKSLLCTNAITLSWYDKTFSLEFAALDYANPRSNQYKYKLEGYDEEWIFTDASRRIASYSNLAPGTYDLKVFGSNNDGIWGDSPAVLKIIVLPPWWLTWWSISIYIGIGVLILWFVYKYVVSRIELRKNEEVHQAKLQFFTEISHEFRTPLTLIIDPAEKLLSEYSEKGNNSYYISLIYRNAKQLLLLVNQLLDFRKLEAGHFSLNLQQSDIIASVRSVAESFEIQAKNRNILFEIKTSVPQLITSFDLAKFNMIINNLLSNAFKFTPDNGEITIRIDRATNKEGIQISVSDTGIGINKDELKKVFDLFHQSKKPVIHQEGTGIGLALTKELVQLHGGRLTVHSENEKGACFSIFLPIVVCNNIEITDRLSTTNIASREYSREMFTQASSTTLELPLMLTVDDNSDVCNYVASIFQKQYRVERATNGKDGFQKAIEIIPDVVISDVMMPGMTGLELCRRLKTDERTSHIPVILLTAHQSDESKTEGFETGADAYVTKPFNSNVLRVQMHNILEQRQKLRELYSKGTPLEIKKIAINVIDETFLKKATLLVEQNIHDENFNIDALAGKLKMSRSQLFRKIKALTNLSLQDFIITIRMKQALNDLLSGEFSISEIAYKVGYSLPSNFTRTFVNFYGKSPSQYLKSIRNL